MINWRWYLHQIIWRVRDNPKRTYIKYLDSIQYDLPASLLKLQNERLSLLLLHAFEKVPYYKTVLGDCRVVQGSQVHLENFSKIPLLTKDIILREKEALYSNDRSQRKSFTNTSGGSTGEPVLFLQDYEYSLWSYAVHRHFQTIALRHIGDSLVKLWGSERDVFQGSESLSTRFTNWLENITILNSFIMSEKNINKYIERWNNARPCLVLAYTTSMFEFARFVERKGVTIHTPRAIVCSAEVLTEEVRTYIEKVMHAPVLNQYGSREVSLIACECPARQGLHVFSLFNKVEILDSALCECDAGKMGDVVVTNLANYSMPLIRYQIGDTAMNAVSKSCECGRSWPLIAAISGRKSDHFCHKNGTLVHGEYFTHLFYNRPDIKQFQVIQRDYEKVEVLIVPRTPLTEHSRNDIIEKIRLVLGRGCEVLITLVEQIPRTASGKYRYTISEVTPR